MREKVPGGTAADCGRHGRRLRAAWPPIAGGMAADAGRHGRRRWFGSASGVVLP